MKVKDVIWLSLALIMVLPASVQALPAYTSDNCPVIFSGSGSVFAEGIVAVLPANSLLAGIIMRSPASTFGRGLIIPGGSPTQNETLVNLLLQGNMKFREDVYNASIERYQELAASQNPGVLWVGCSDSRSDPERITSAGPGEIFVTRNIGNIVPSHDWSMAAVLEYSINYLNVQEIVICGHSDCGAMKALDKELHDPYIPLWLNDARQAKTQVDTWIPVPTTAQEEKERRHQIELENVRLQMEHLLTYPSVKEAVGEGRISVHGLYYDLSTGTLSKVT
jgi:carbonic anhydrase